MKSAGWAGAQFLLAGRTVPAGHVSRGGREEALGQLVHQPAAERLGWCHSRASEQAGQNNPTVVTAQITDAPSSRCGTARGAH